jgi:hypothetical protein
MKTLCFTLLLAICTSFAFENSAAAAPAMRATTLATIKADGFGKPKTINLNHKKRKQNREMRRHRKALGLT